MSIIVSIALATICFTHTDQVDRCHPVLLGPTTPKGEYSLIRRFTVSPGYGGDVLQFKETESTVYAIHRVWTLRSAEHRVQRLASPVVSDRQRITNGCINLEPAVYDQLLDCCTHQNLVIQ